MAILSTTINGSVVNLPAPVSIQVGDEIIWSSNTGRSSSGRMLGDVIAQKLTLSIVWGVLKSSELNVIKTALRAGFYPLTFNIDGTSNTIDAYRGTLAYEAMGQMTDSLYYFKNTTVDIVQQ